MDTKNDLSDTKQDVLDTKTRNADSKMDISDTKTYALVRKMASGVQ